MKVKQVIKLVRMKITDEDINRWEDYQIIEVINEAVRFIRNIFIEQQPTMIAQKVTGFLVAGENTIEFDFAPLKIVDIRCVGKRLHLTSIHNIDDTESEALPKYLSLLLRSVLKYILCLIALISMRPLSFLLPMSLQRKMSCHSQKIIAIT